MTYPYRFEEHEAPGSRSFFTEIIASISDIKFGKDGRHILSRDYMTLKRTLNLFNKWHRRILTRKQALLLKLLLVLLLLLLLLKLLKLLKLLLPKQLLLLLLLLKL
ncbi:uncharacterized protein LOC109830459 [Asparagus officinalis]|uniref:uncharacterized protein LOC109830459 n=1 Tax=Asparagus officinalis TaxID=4686 RepID=UPI00098E19A4|nr:uncharacterized protein LOC109830459 [Asparagus officinalis]